MHVKAVARNVDRNKIYEDFSSVLASARQTQYYPMFPNFVSRVIDTSREVPQDLNEMPREILFLSVEDKTQDQGAVLRHPSVREEQLGFQPRLRMEAIRLE